MPLFDINCDMGEGFGNWRTCDDAAVMPLISSANIACGFHAGDPNIMRSVVQMAKEHGVAVGAHPGLPDLLGFGRRVMAVTPNDLYAYFIYQVGALQGFVAAEGMQLNHVKPHGALFHVLRNPELAEAAVDAVNAVAPGASVYWPGPGLREPFTERAAARNIRVCTEAYPDLDYGADGSLIVERHKKEVVPELAYDRVHQIVATKKLTTRDGDVLPMDVESVCLHGDSPNALTIISAARKAIEASGYEVGCTTK
jgi:UPF0271 protein